MRYEYKTVVIKYEHGRMLCDGGISWHPINETGMEARLGWEVATAIFIREVQLYSKTWR